MKKPDAIPADDDRIKIVDSMEAFCLEPLGRASVIVYPRSLSMNFNALAYQLEAVGEVQPGRVGMFYSHDLDGMSRYLDHEARQALKQIESDMRDIFRLQPYKPYLRVVTPDGYDNKRIYDFHIDRNTVWDGRILCAYNARPMRGLREEDAIPNVGGRTFTVWPSAKFIEFEPGDLTRHAFQGKSERPFIHQAQKIEPGDAPKLLLVAR